MIETLLRDLAPAVLGALVRRYRDFADAEDALQEALLAAAEQWPAAGVPDNPRAWLWAVASRRLTDQIRANAARQRRHRQAAPSPGYAMPPAGDPEEDDTLLLLQMCCHPALSAPSAIALTLRAVGGLTTAEIARAFLVPEATMAQRITRAKQSLRASPLPFEPRGHPAHPGALLRILYLIFNEGYTASSGKDLHRPDLALEAIRLARLVHARLPAYPEAAGLLALMLLTDARRPARTGPLGLPIPLDQQDRALWNQAAIAEGVALVSGALPKGAVGPYQLQAAIAALHDEAATADATDWPQILALYEVLLRVEPSPVVSLNHAVAAAMVHGPAHGLALLTRLDSDPRLRDHHRLAAGRAHLLERAGQTAPAIASYETAARLTPSLPERNYLIHQAARLAQATEAETE